MNKPRPLYFILVAVSLILSACAAKSAPTANAAIPAAPAASAVPTPAAPRERMKSIRNYMVYYGSGRVDDLARYDLAIVQPDSLTAEEISALESKGTLVVAYLSVGEVEPNRAWYTDGRADPRWILGKNEDWGSYFIDARQTGWQKLMRDLTGEFLGKSFQGVFLDTVDTAQAYPQTKDGMVALIHGLRAAYPDALIIQNRGMSVADDTSADLDGLMFEDVSTTYDFEKQEYKPRDNSVEITQMVDFKNRTHLPILGLDYAPADNPGMAWQAYKKSQQNGFIPCISTINLDDIPNYGLDQPGPADLRVSSISAEGDENQVNLVARVQNTGLANAVDIPVAASIAGKPAASITLTLQPGDTYDWSIPWDHPVENVAIQVEAANPQDPSPANNSLSWTFTYASIAMEPLLPYDQQKHRDPANGPQMTASLLSAPPVIDGNLKEWADLPCTEVNTAEQISYGDAAGWSSPDDLSGKVCYGWDQENVYIAMDIRDDIHVQKYTGAALWQGDHVELWFDTQLQLDFDSASNSDDDYQLGISPGDGGKVPADFAIFTPSIPAESYRNLVEWKTILTKTGYTAEIRIPAKVLKGLRLAPDQTIGATFEPSDTDTPGGSDQELMMSSAPQSSKNWGDPTYWNNLIFKGE
jgi:uncharacterized protein (TIGR01370 family)